MLEGYDEVMQEIDEKKQAVDYIPTENEFKGIVSVFRDPVGSRPVNLGAGFAEKFRT